MEGKDETRACGLYHGRVCFDGFSFSSAALVSDDGDL